MQNVWGLRDDRQPVTKQNDIMEEQDTMLDDIYDSLIKQREMAYAIDKETDEQIQLLDDMNHHIDLTSRKVKRENKRIEKFEATSGTKLMWCIICLLFLVLIVVVFMAVGTRK